MPNGCSRQHIEQIRGTCMTIIENKKESETTLKVEGRLDTTTAPQLESKLKECIKGINQLTLDLSAIDYISSAGLRVVLLAHKMMASIGGKLKVHQPSPFCRQVFEATGMDAVLTIV